MNRADFKALRAKGIYQWQIAEKLGIREDALSRMLRHELAPEDEVKIKAAINTIAREMESNATDQTE